MSNLDTIDAFFDAWARLDADAVLALMTPDCEYHNIPMPVLRGHAEIDGFVRPFLGNATFCKFTVHHQAINAEGTVFNERTDVMDMPGGAHIELPVTGVFEFRDGLISRWRDYFDLGQFERQMAGKAQ